MVRVSYAISFYRCAMQSAAFLANNDNTCDPFYDCIIEDATEISAIELALESSLTTSPFICVVSNSSERVSRDCK